MKLENIVVLQYADNECYTTVVVPIDAIKKHGKNFSIDLTNNTWIYNNKRHKIGESCYIDNHSHYGVIGVYDQTLIKHLNRMVMDSKSATESGHYDFNIT